MHIRVIGSNVEINDTLNDYVTEHLNHHVKKYFENAINADVHFTKERNSVCATIVINEGVKGGIIIKSNGEAADAKSCFNDALDKASKQLRKYKSRIKNYRREKGGIKNAEFDEKAFDAPKYVLAAAPYDLLEEIEEEETAAMKEEESVKIISEKTTLIEELTVDQAIMKMDLASLPALVFINGLSKRLNVVYHRKDGNISWIDANIG